MLNQYSHNAFQSYSYTGEGPLLVHHVALMCGIACRTVRWAAAQGLLKGFKDPITPKIWKFWRSDALAYFEKRRLARFRSRKLTEG